MIRSDGSSPNAEKFCPIFRKNISGLQCQLYQGVEYKKAAVCKKCPHRNEATDDHEKR